MFLYTQNHRPVSDGFVLLIRAADSSWMVSVLGAGPRPEPPCDCHCDSTMSTGARQAHEEYHWTEGFRATATQNVSCQRFPVRSAVCAWELACLATLQWAGGSLGPTCWAALAASWGTSAQPRAEVSGNNTLPEFPLPVPKLRDPAQGLEFTEALWPFVQRSTWITEDDLRA